MRGGKGFPKHKKFGGKIFTWHSSYIAGHAKSRAIKQRDRWKKLGYRVRVVEHNGSYALYRRKK